MKISIAKDKKGNILSVHSFDFYNERNVNDERIISTTEKANKEEGYEKYVNIEIPEYLSECFHFLLGDNKYKTHKKIESICTSLNDIKESLESIQSDVYDTERFLEDILSKIEKINENE